MKDKRKFERFQLNEDLMFAHQLTHPYCYYEGKTRNFSTHGICFASHYEVETGDTLCVRMIGDHLHACTPVDGMTCKAEVRWCRPVVESQGPRYHIGLHVLGEVPARFRPSGPCRKKTKSSRPSG